MIDGRKAVFGQSSYPGERITYCRNLLPLLKGSSLIVNRNFYGRIAFPKEFDYQFKVEIEAITFKLQSMKTISPENLILVNWVLNSLPIHQVKQTGKYKVTEMEKGSNTWLLFNL